MAKKIHVYSFFISVLTFSTTLAAHTWDVFSGPSTSLEKVMLFIGQFLIKKMNLVQNLWGLVDRILLLLVGLFFTEY